jgi:hypothetical protein
MISALLMTESESEEDSRLFNPLNTAVAELGDLFADDSWDW